MDGDCAIQAIDLFLSMSDGAKEVEFVFTGGEPLLRYRTLVDTIKHATIRSEALGVQPTFVLKTNGVLMNKKVCSFLKANSVKTVVSVDGAPESHNLNRRTFSGGDIHHTVLKNIQILLSYGVEIVVSLTVTPERARYLLQNVEFLYGNGIRHIDVGPAYGSVFWCNGTINEFNDGLRSCAYFIAEKKYTDPIEIGPLYANSQHRDSMLQEHWGCRAGATNLAFMPNGEIVGCSALGMVKYRYPELIIGHVRTGVNGDSLGEFFRCTQAGQNKRNSCLNCAGSANCTGGCLAINLATTGTQFQSPEFYCSMMKNLPIALGLAWGDEGAMPKQLGFAKTGVHSENT
jgi:uncharacterized protein